MIHPKTLIFTDGAILFKEGDAGDCAYYIEEGIIDLFSSFGNRETLLGTMGTGDLLGEMALLDHQARSATAKARGLVRVIHIHSSQIDERLEHADPMIALLLKAILQRFREMRKRLHLVADKDRLDVLDIGRENDPTTPYAAESKLVGKAIKDEMRLRYALENAEFELFAQPIVSLPERNLIGAEGLLRWRHPVEGLLGPDRVITAAEQNGLIIDIGYMLIRRGCNVMLTFDQLFAAEQLTNPLSFMSINVSPQQLREVDFTARVHDILHETGIAPWRIKLEITESTMLEQPQLAEDRLKSLRAVGVRIALDDFGTGYSSLSTLMDYPIDTLKIDRSFVTRMGEDRKAFNIIKIILALANTLGFDTIVEGIEYDSQAAVLAGLGCTAAQGYLFAKPLPMNELAAFAGLFCNAQDLPSHLSPR